MALVPELTEEMLAITRANYVGSNEKHPTIKKLPAHNTRFATEAIARLFAQNLTRWRYDENMGVALPYYNAPTVADAIAQSLVDAVTTYIKEYKVYVSADQVVDAFRLATSNRKIKELSSPGESGLDERLIEQTLHQLYHHPITKLIKQRFYPSGDYKLRQTDREPLNDLSRTSGEQWLANKSREYSGMVAGISTGSEITQVPTVVNHPQEQNAVDVLQLFIRVEESVLALREASNAKIADLWARQDPDHDRMQHILARVILGCLDANNNLFLENLGTQATWAMTKMGVAVSPDTIIINVQEKGQNENRPDFPGS